MLRQFLTLGAGETAGRALHAVALLLLARAVGAEGLGRLGLAQSVASYGVMAVQLGMDPLAIRNVAQQPALLPGLSGLLFGLRLSCAAAFVLCLLFWRPEPLVLVLSGLVFAAALQQRWMLLATQRTMPVALATVLAQLPFLLVVLWPGVTILQAAVAISAGELGAAAITFFVASPSPKPSIAGAGDLLVSAWPMAVSMLLANMLYNFDVLALAWLGSKQQIGIYLAAYRLITVFSPILGALQNSALPRLAALSSDAAAARVVALRVMRNTTLVAAAVALVTIGGAGLWIRLFYGEAFSDAAPVLRILGVVLPIQAARMVLRQLVYAFGLQKQDMWNLLLAVALNVVLDLVLVPQYGPIGCAVSTVCAEALYLAATFICLRGQR